MDIHHLKHFIDFNKSVSKMKKRTLNGIKWTKTLTCIYVNSRNPLKY